MLKQLNFKMINIDPNLAHLSHNYVNTFECSNNKQKVYEQKLSLLDETQN